MRPGEAAPGPANVRHVRRRPGPGRAHDGARDPRAAVGVDGEAIVARAHAGDPHRPHDRHA